MPTVDKEEIEQMFTRCITCSTNSYLRLFLYDIELMSLYGVSFVLQVQPCTEIKAKFRARDIV